MRSLHKDRRAIISLLRQEGELEGKKKLGWAQFVKRAERGKENDLVRTANRGTQGKERPPFADFKAGVKNTDYKIQHLLRLTSTRCVHLVERDQKKKKERRKGKSVVHSGRGQLCQGSGRGKKTDGKFSNRRGEER